MFAAPRRSRSALLLSLFTLSACGGGNTPPPPTTNPPPAEKPLATLQGQLAPTPGTEVTRPVRLALAWYPGLLTEGPGPVSNPLGIVTEDVAYPGGFPASYTFDVTSPPPAEALVQLGDGMRGRGSVGILLAYDDRNGNTTLDTIPADGTPVDRVLGASLAWTRPPAFMVVYLDSAQAPATGLKQGFNLVRITDNLTSQVVPLTTPIPLSLHDDPMLDAFVCEAAWDDTVEQAPCGLGDEEPVEGLLTLGGELVVNGTRADVSLEVRRDGESVKAAQVTVGDEVATYDATLERYTLHLEDTSGTLGSGLVTVMAKVGEAEVARTVVVPGDFQVTWPTLPMSYSPGASVRVAWTLARGASDYTASVVAGDQVLASDETQGRWLELSPLAYGGDATVRVVASEESDGLVVRRVRELPISFTSCDSVTEGSELTVEGEFEQYAWDILQQEASSVRVEVKDGGIAVTDAKVMLSGWDVPYLNEQGAYSNGFYSLGPPVFGDTVELRVMREGEVLCRTLTLPGDFDLTLHGEAERPTGSPLAVSWTRAPGAVRYDLLLEPALQQPLYSASTNELEYTFEKVDAVGNLSLRVAAVAHPAHNDTLGWMDVKRLRLGGATFTGVTTAE
ncbi:hypothetical protein [Myxococcus sp. RHSTA-1-4]|uniref:hypothetical protein n=1 Tax=Myxococcus sp. RHSTA-1-4 TaxID=2874601 RepID=UPI001CC1686F|nr:hypothetical protein [Myxococcus sp. RHSTA-1-4]MBZ4416836.1 hypothetical protein [Myxococcus sp. RHSTA-1-4]